MAERCGGWRRIADQARFGPDASWYYQGLLEDRADRARRRAERVQLFLRERDATLTSLAAMRERLAAIAAAKALAELEASKVSL